MPFDSGFMHKNISVNVKFAQALIQEGNLHLKY